MRGIGERGEGHIAVRHEAQAAAARIRHLGPAHACARPTFLRHEVTRQVFFRRRFKNAQPCAPAAVDIVFLRAQAIVAHAVNIRVQLHHHTKLRHVGKTRQGVVGQGDAHGPAGLHRVAQGALRLGRSGQRIAIGDGNRPVPVLYGSGMDALC